MRNLAVVLTASLALGAFCWSQYRPGPAAIATPLAAAATSDLAVVQEQTAVLQAPKRHRDAPIAKPSPAPFVTPRPIAAAPHPDDDMQQALDILTDVDRDAAERVQAVRDFVSHARQRLSQDELGMRLAEMLGQEAHAFRLGVLDAMRTIQAPSVVPTLIGLLEDESAEIRLHTLHALSNHAQRPEVETAVRRIRWGIHSKDGEAAAKLLKWEHRSR